MNILICYYNNIIHTYLCLFLKFGCPKEEIKSHHIFGVKGGGNQVFV